MLSLPLLAVFLAATPAPHAVDNADAVVFTARLSSLAHLQGFLGPASEHSVLLQPRSYAEDFHPLLLVDPFDAASLEAVGMDTAGAATVSRRGNQRFACVGVKDAALFEKRALQRLDAFGDAGVKKVQGSSVHVATREGTLVAAYVLKGGTSCAWSGGTLTPADLAELARLPGHVSTEAQRALTGIPGVLWVMDRGLAVGLDGAGAELKVEGRSTARSSALMLQSASSSPYATARPSGLLFTRLRAEPSALVGTFTNQLLPACEACRGAEFSRWTEALAHALTGDALLRVDQLSAGGSISKPAARLNALHFGVVLELKDAAEGKRLVERLGQTSPAHAVDGGAVVPLEMGELSVRVQGRNLFVSNSAQALAQVDGANAGSSGPVRHALDAKLDPALAAKALRQISLLDVLANRELAGLFAVGTELGPLLGASESISFWAQPRGAQMQFGMSWTLSPNAKDR